METDCDAVWLHIKNNDFVSFLKAFDRNCALIRNEKGFNLLHVASACGDVRIARYLLQYIDPNLTNDKFTPLYFASQDGHEKIVELLVNNPKVDPNIVNGEGWTPLHIASLNGHEKTVEILLSNSKVEVNIASVDGWTPLYVASENGRDNIVKTLLSNTKVDPNIANVDGWTPLCCASEIGNQRITEILLCNQRVDPNIANANGCTPLYIACLQGHERIVEILLSNPKVNPNISNNNGMTPIKMATVKGHEGIINILSGNPKVDDGRCRIEEGSAGKKQVIVKRKLEELSKLIEVDKTERKSKRTVITGMKVQQETLSKELEQLSEIIRKKEEQLEEWEYSFKWKESEKAFLGSQCKLLSEKLKRLAQLGQISIESLSVDQVQETMRLEGITEDDLEKLKKNRVDGSVLSILDESGLDDYGIGLMARKRILSIVERRRKGSISRELKGIEVWSLDEVEKWMKENGMEMEADKFKQVGVDGIVFEQLQAKDLRELGILDMGRRNQMMTKINALREIQKNGHEETENPKVKDSTIDENDLLCPITGCFMEDPVTAADGFSYERSAITRWFGRKKLTSPVTNKRLRNKILHPNHRLKAIINSHLENKAQTSSNSS
eukprot:TRINITY_DN7282_c0_g3_i2.p1 TRINITY_DN7282_c0_g3~~TRINITY_DN7282_c0_g3_i2.p1  ORF type:complete len:612 (-),score=161.43 TRINITY_DN7282_c0_g3_i2:112-1947(-)